MMEPVGIRAFYDLHAAEYDDTYRDVQYAMEDAKVTYLMDGLHWPILDVGCGTGQTLSMIDVPPDQYLGVDLSEGMLQIARSKHPDYEFRQADGMDVVRSGGHYGSIIGLYGLFSYLDTPWLFLKHAIDSLLPGGVLFVMAYGPTPETRPYIRCDAEAWTFTTQQLIDVCPHSSRIESAEIGELFGGIATYMRLGLKGQS